MTNLTRYEILDTFTQQEIDALYEGNYDMFIEYSTRDMDKIEFLTLALTINED